MSSPSFVPQASHLPTDISTLSSDSLRHALVNSADLRPYLRRGEVIVGFGYGGSESVTLFIQTPDRHKLVRKILSDRFLTTAWDREGRDVMLPPQRKAEAQARWLLDLPPQVKSVFPRVLGFHSVDDTQKTDGSFGRQEFIYDMSYVPGIEFSRFVRQYRPSPALVALLYSQLFSCLAKHVHRFRRRVPKGPTLEVSYFKKIEKRLALAHKNAPRTFPRHFLDSDYIFVNGVRLKNVPLLLRIFRSRQDFQAILEPRFHSLVVGDTNTENIKLNSIEPVLALGGSVDFDRPPFSVDDLGITFLDPRAIGFHENGADTGADDPMYDNKPWHNSLGNYDVIHGEHFDLRAEVDAPVPAFELAFHKDHPYAYSYRDIGSYFHKAMNKAWNLDEPDSPFLRDDPYWLVRFVFVMGTHFMAMPPFHFRKNEEGQRVDDPKVQRRPLAIYLEGIRWLNLAIDLLEGRVREYLGFQMPSLDGVWL